MEALNKQNFEDLIKGKESFLSSSDSLPKAILSGSFNPLHKGHKAMHDHARKVLDFDIFHFYQQKNVNVARPFLILLPASEYIAIKS